MDCVKCHENLNFHTNLIEARLNDLFNLIHNENIKAVITRISNAFQWTIIFINNLFGLLQLWGLCGCSVTSGRVIGRCCV